MSALIGEAGLGLTPRWSIADVEFDEAGNGLTIQVDVRRGSRVQSPDFKAVHPVHDTVTKHYQDLNVYQHECFLDERVPRIKLSEA